MRVLHIYKGYYPTEIGGICEFIKQLSLSTKKLDVDNQLLVMTSAPGKQEIELIDGIKVHWCPIHLQAVSTPISLRALIKYRKLLDTVDIIHYHFPYPFSDLLHTIFRTKKPSIVTYHSDIIRQKFLLKLYKPLRNSFLNSVDSIVATSPIYLQTSDVLQKFKHKVSVIPIGLDKALSPKPSEKRLSYWLDRLPPRFFLFIGAMRYYKALPILMRAAKMNKYPVVIVGGGNLKNKYIKQAKSLNVENVEFLGTVPEEDKAALLNLCHAVILPSNLRSEALGIALIEGSMYSKPLISCEIGTGTSFVNIDKETGLVATPNDPTSLNQAMQQIWENKKLAEEMGKRSFKRYQNLFIAEKMANSYYDLYKGLLNENKNQPAPL